MQICLEDTLFDNIELHKDFFISAIAHDNRGGRRVMHFGKGKRVRRSSASKVETLCKESITSVSEDSYITLNTFTKSSNKYFNLYNRAGIFVDIDGHGLSVEELDVEKEKFLSCFCLAVNEGFLPVPTIVNDTGRGFAVFYILDRSISAKNTGSCKYLDTLQGIITSRIADVINSNEIGLSVDLSVGDVSRIVRLPGTYNTAAGAWCRIIFADMDEDDERSIRYTSTDELKMDGKIFSSDNRKKYRKKLYYEKHGKTYNIARYLDATTKDLTRLLFEEAEKSSTGYRENLLFLIYNQTVQCMDKTDAVEYVRNLNNSLPCPLHDREVDHLIKCVDSCPDFEAGGIRGYYLFTYEMLRAKANLTPEQCKERHILVSARDTERYEKKQTNKKAREKRNEEIVKMAANHTYAEVAETFGLSIPSIKKILKANGFKKYNFLAESQIEFHEGAAKRNSWTGMNRSFFDAPDIIDSLPIIEDPFPFSSFVSSDTSGFSVKSFFVPSEKKDSEKGIVSLNKKKRCNGARKNILSIEAKAVSYGYKPDDLFLCLQPVHIRALRLLSESSDLPVSFLSGIQDLLRVVVPFCVALDAAYVYVPVHLLSSCTLGLFADGSSVLGHLCDALLPAPVFLEDGIKQALVDYHRQVSGLDQDFSIPIRFMTFAEIEQEHDGVPKLYKKAAA